MLVYELFIKNNFMSPYRLNYMVFSFMFFLGMLQFRFNFFFDAKVKREGKEASITAGRPEEERGNVR